MDFNSFFFTDRIQQRCDFLLLKTYCRLLSWTHASGHSNCLVPAGIVGLKVAGAFCWGRTSIDCSSRQHWHYKCSTTMKELWCGCMVLSLIISWSTRADHQLISVKELWPTTVVHSNIGLLLLLMLLEVVSVETQSVGITAALTMRCCLSVT